MPNQGLLAISFFEGAALLVLLVLFFLLYRDVPARYLRLWLIGWTIFTVYGAAVILHLVGDSLPGRVLMPECYLAATICFLAAVLVHTGRERWLPFVWPLAMLSGLAIGLVDFWQATPGGLAVWSTSLFQCAILIGAGWILWRYAQGRAGHGAPLLGAALFLCGMHRIDLPNWSNHPLFLLRMAFNGLLEMVVGISMAVMVLEATRTRTEDLNEKLRRLSLITAASTQTFNVDEVLKEVLEHLVESLNVSHGLVRLLTGEGESAQMVLRASVGYSPPFLEKHARIPPSESWLWKIIEQSEPFLSYEQERHPEMRQRMEAEKIESLVVVRLPGKDKPLGLLALGSATSRRFQADEINFLVNVANLLGLTVQNVSLFEQAATAQRQWMYTFDSIGDPILVHDQGGRIVRANERLGERLGYSPDSLIGRQVAEVFHFGQSTSPLCPYCEGVAGEGDDRDPRLGGYYLASNSDFHNPGGERLGTVHVLKDITERKRAEEKYRNLVENLQEGVFISTPEGRFIDFNDAFMQMLGYERREDLLRVDIPSTVYVNPADRERLKKLLREHGSVTNFEFQMRRRDGEVLTVLETSFAARDASGGVTAYQGFVLDITERKRAEQEIRRRNRELLVLNSIGQTLNQPLELNEILGRALRQVMELFALDTGAIYLLEEKSRVVRRVASAGLRSEFARHFPPVALPAELIDHIRIVRATVLSAQGLPLPPVFRELQQKEAIQVSHIVVLWSKDRMIGALTVGSRTLREYSSADLNLLTSIGSQIATTIEKLLLYEETRRAYENLRRTQEQLLQSEKMAALGQLISGVAHELNNPLTAILGYSQLLSASEHVTPRGAEYVDKLYKQTQRTHRIVHNLLSFARQQKPERLPVRLNQVLEDTLALREYDLKVNNIQVHRELAPELPPSAADAHQLQQVFLNILNNAVDAILERSDHGEVWVRSAMDDGRLVIEFTDSGAGVQDLLRVFDPFYTTKPIGKGTGLGLSICYGIVSEHGGEIAVRNSPPRGATFSISLPVLPVAELNETSRPGKVEMPSGGRVLLVDDEEAVLELEQEILRDSCQVVKTARSGREAMQLLEKEAFDLVVTDLKMPGELAGRELYKWIGRHRPELTGRVIFTVSDGRTGEFRALLEESGCPFIQKPFEVDKFLSVIRRALGQAPASLLKR